MPGDVGAFGTDFELMAFGEDLNGGNRGGLERGQNGNGRFWGRRRNEVDKREERRGCKNPKPGRAGAHKGEGREEASPSGIFSARRFKIRKSWRKAAKSEIRMRKLKREGSKAAKSRRIVNRKS